MTQRADELAHMLMHAQDVHHHHHADHTMHLDDAAVDLNHLHADSASGAIALMQWRQTTVASLRPMYPTVGVPATWPSPTLEGLLRPPAQSV